MASLLLNASSGSYVSMEKLDDVAQEDADGEVLAIQSKDCEVTNPVSDRSVQMWKTFANWSRDVRERRLDVTRTTFEIYVNRKVQGKLVNVFAEVSSKSAAQDAFERARALLWGEAPNFTKKAKLSRSLVPHLEEVFATSPKAFKSIVERFQLTCALKNPELDLYDAVRKMIALEPDDLVIEVLVDIYGWVRKLVNEALRQRKAPVIAADEFMLHLKGSYSRIKPGGALPDLGGDDPTPMEITKLMCGQFVRQIEIINAEKETKERAITCLFKARAARTKWGANGHALVHDKDIAEFEHVLKQVWRNFRTEVFSDPARTEEDLRGRLLLARCEQHSCLVEQKAVPAYFIPGCFHELADRLTVGWHPRYEPLLRAPAS